MTAIHLVLAMDRNTDGDDYGEDSTECRSILGTGVLRKFLKETPKLRKLTVGFDMTPDVGEHTHAASLEHLLEEGYTWPDLNTFSVRAVDSDVQFLLDFLTRHKCTVKNLGLEEMKLRSPNDDDDDSHVSLVWQSLLSKIRDLLELEDALVRRELLGGNESDSYTEFWGISDPMIGEDERRDLLTSYLTRVTDVFPLDEDNMGFEY
jgi:hypothetical protein